MWCVPVHEGLQSPALPSPPTEHFEANHLTSCSLTLSLHLLHEVTQDKEGKNVQMEAQKRSYKVRDSRSPVQLVVRCTMQLKQSLVTILPLLAFWSHTAIRSHGKCKDDSSEKSKAAIFTKCGQKDNFTPELKEDEGCPGRQESGRVADVLLCLLETRVSE